MLIAGTTSMALYLRMIAAFTALAVSAGASLPSPGQISIAVPCGLAVSFLTGALLFGALPHWLATLMERSSSMFEYSTGAPCALRSYRY
jgi:H+/gluconate symporter-like permease